MLDLFACAQLYMCVCVAKIFEGTLDVVRKQWEPFEDDIESELVERVTRLRFAEVGRDWKRK